MTRSWTAWPNGRTGRWLPGPVRGRHPRHPEAADLFFRFVSGRYERASVIVTSNNLSGCWGEVFGDDTVAAAMIDRLVHHAE
ncbi:ATP-binding protein [Streptomyces sp. NPDC059590]|uniref:ATP-binding protein n=1 Tax=Streptomyces sp. NPDC059590 TaxID=3346877 RepID=UPI0036A0042F